MSNPRSPWGWKMAALFAIVLLIIVGSAAYFLIPLTVKETVKAIVGMIISARTISSIGQGFCAMLHS